MQSIRVLLTDQCNYSCPNCINRNIRNGNVHMDKKHFAILCRYFHENNVPRIRIMGGEPTLHPDFGEMTRIAQYYFDRVTVFTNGTTSSIHSFTPRELDGINYNFTFAKKWTRNTFVKGQYNLTISLIILSSLKPKEVFEDIERILSYGIKPCISLTFDCLSNIFEQRKSLISNFQAIYTFVQSLGLEVIIDHALPLCFVYGSKIPVPRKHSSCKDCAGLIDATYNLRYCNQFSRGALPIFKGDKIIPFHILDNHISLEYHLKQAEVLDKICKSCPLFGEECTGGCYLNNKSITHSDIVNNTLFPIM